MSIPHARKGRHAAPAKPTGRRLAVAAAALAAGAVPLACAGAASAATAPQTAVPMLPTLGLPNLPLPLGLPDSVGSLAQGLPLAGDLPISDVVSGVTPPIDEIVQVGNLGVIPEQPARSVPMIRSAPVPQQPTMIATNAENMALGAGGLATAADHALTDGAQSAAERLTGALPLNNLVPQLASTSGGPLQLAPNVLHEGAIGTLASGIAPQARNLSGGLVGQAQPLVSQLHSNGVPTVGDLTGGLSATQLPVVGTVGSVTQTLPVTTLLGSSSPVTGVLQNVSGV